MRKIKTILATIRSFAIALWQRDAVRRVVHTFWQAFTAVFIVGISGVVQTLWHTRSISAAAAALVSLIVASLAAAFAAVRVMYAQRNTYQ